MFFIISNIAIKTNNIKIIFKSIKSPPSYAFYVVFGSEITAVIP